MKAWYIIPAIAVGITSYTTAMQESKNYTDICLEYLPSNLFINEIILKHILENPNLDIAEKIEAIQNLELIDKKTSFCLRKQENKLKISAEIEKKILLFLESRAQTLHKKITTIKTTKGANEQLRLFAINSNFTKEINEKNLLYLNKYIIKKLIQQDMADIDDVGTNGTTALHLAVENKSNPTLCKVLLMFKANPNIKNQTGQTPLMLARLRGNALGFKLLLQAHANVDQTDNEERTLFSDYYGRGVTSLSTSQINAIINEKKDCCLNKTSANKV